MYFFESSSAAHDSLTDTFDFAEPARGALWNFRWQLRGYLNVRPDADELELHNRFLHATSIHYHNLRNWPAKSWDETEQQLARFLLINIIAIYESWIANTLEAIGAKTKENERGLQFPSSDPKGYDWVLGKLAKSSVMRRCFGAPLRRAKRCASPMQLSNLMVCYRTFKEYRNAIAHAGAKATQRTLDAYQSLLKLSPSDLGVKQLPVLVQPHLGTRVKLSLRGVIGLSAVMLRLLTTLDCELAETGPAEAAFLARWRRAYPGVTRLNDQLAGRHSSLSTMIHEMALPRPEAHADLVAFLQHHNAVRF